MLLVTPEELQVYRDRYAAALSSATGAAVDGDGADIEDATADAAIVANVEEAMDAAFWIGYCYYYKTGGVERDHEEAKRIWSEALELHGRHKERQRRQLCRDGKSDDKDGGVRDKTGKLRYYVRFFEQGERNEELLRESIPRLQWEAAELNDRIAQHDLGFCYWLGYGGLEPDPKQEAHWYERSAQQGHPEAQHGIADCYEKGRGVQKDFVKAIYWYDKAIANKHAHAIRSKHEMIARKIHPEVRARVLACVQNLKFMEDVPRLVAAATRATSNVVDSAAATPSSSFMGLFLQAVQTLAGVANREREHQVINNRISHNNMSLYTPIYWTIQAMASLKYFAVPNHDKAAQELSNKKQRVSSSENST